MCGFLETITRKRDRKRDRQTERDETVFNGPNCPVGVGPKMVRFKKRKCIVLGTPKKPKKGQE